MCKIFETGIPCVFHKVTNLYCPGCGITRAIFALLDFKFYQAFRYNILVVSLIILSIIYLIACIIKYIVKKEFFIKIPKYIYISLLVITILFGILRNIPAFAFLAPITV